jgi:hypothetical protein
MYVGMPGAGCRNRAHFHAVRQCDDAALPELNIQRSTLNFQRPTKNYRITYV